MSSPVDMNCIVAPVCCFEQGEYLLEVPLLGAGPRRRHLDGLPGQVGGRRRRSPSSNRCCSSPAARSRDQRQDRDGRDPQPPTLPVHPDPLVCRRYRARCAGRRSAVARCRPRARSARAPARGFAGPAARRRSRSSPDARRVSCRRDLARAPSCPPSDGRLRDVKCTSTSEPERLAKVDGRRKRRSSGASASIAASSMSSGRMPSDDRPPSNRARPGRVDAARRACAAGCRRTRTQTPSSSRSSGRLEQVHRRRADEPGDEQVTGRVVEHLRRVDLLEPALLEHGDAVAHRHRLDLVVRDVDRGHAEVRLDPGDLGPHLDAQLRVEVRQRLVHEERAGSRTIARPIATRWRWPPESCSGLRSRGPRARGRRRPRAPAGRSRPSASCAASGRRPCCRTRSCAGRARSSGTPSRCRGPSAATSLTTRSPIGIVAAGDLLETGDHAQRGRLAAARTGRRAPGTRRRRCRGRGPRRPGCRRRRPC